MSNIYVFAEQNDPGDSEIIVHEQLFKDGDYVDEGQAIFVVEGSKALFDIEAPHSGYIISKTIVSSKIQIGSILAEITSEVNPH
jgi:pyruvate/2-oxoglutarate dehydrogenase complex dihydrolipoamide acyltransferase (E2) component